MKIQVRLMLVIIPVLVVTFAVSSVITNIFSTSALENQVRENAKLLSNSYSEQLNAKIEQNLNISQDLGNAVITSINIETTLQVLRKRYPQYTSVFYTTSKGDILDMAPFNRDFVGVNLSNLRSWKKALETKSPTISEPGEYFGEPSIIIFAPALLSYVYNQEPTVEGLVAMVLPLNELFREISTVTIGESGSIFIINNQGTFIYHDMKDYILKETLSQLPSVESLNKVSEAMINQKTGFATYSDNLGRKYISFSPITSIGWSLGVHSSYNEITSKLNKITIINLIVVISGVIVGIIIIYFTVHTVVLPIEKLTIMARKIEKGDRSITSDLKTSSEVGLLSRAINLMVRELRDHHQKLEIQVEKRTEELKRTNEELEDTVDELNAANNSLQHTRDALWSEMELAQKLQTVLLPEKPIIDGYEVAAFVETAKTVGGDYFDVIHVEDRDWFLIGDVSGHGVNSGLIMMMVQTSIHVALSQNPTLNPSDLLTLINQTIHNNIHKLGKKSYMTMTVFACHDHGSFVFSGAHLPLIRYKKISGEIEVTETEGVWIGMVDDIKGMNRDFSYTLDEGDTLLLYTDGITESKKKNGEYYTEKDLQTTFSGLAEKSCREIVSGIRTEMENLIFDDDVTIFVIKRKTADVAVK